jgi:hypothetical protein
MRMGGGGLDLPPIPSGNHLAICYQLIELGTQDDTYQGREKKAFKIRIGWELPEVTAMFPDDNGNEVEKPRVISREYALSAHEKSTLRIHANAWRGKAFTDAEFEDFDIAKFLGKPCLLQIVNADKGEKTYSNIAAVTSIPKGMPIPEQFNEFKYLTFSEWDWDLYNSMPKFIKEKIDASPEFQALNNYNQPAPAPAPAPRQQTHQQRQQRQQAPAPAPQSRPAAAWGQAKPQAAPPPRQANPPAPVAEEYDDDLPF